MNSSLNKMQSNIPTNKVKARDILSVPMSNSPHHYGLTRESEDHQTSDFQFFNKIKKPKVKHVASSFDFEKMKSVSSFDAVLPYNRNTTFEGGSKKHEFNSKLASHQLPRTLNEEVWDG